MGRSVVVGDVQGCRAELDALLDALVFGSGDRLFLVGDLVVRGPDSAGVLRLVRQVGGRSVVGNHEQRLLEAHAARERGEPGPSLGPAQQRAFDELGDEDWAMLRSLPLFLDLPDHGVRIVHAGLDPAAAFEDQDPWVLTHIRTIEADGSVSDRWSGELWGARYDGPPHIVFGHNAQVEPQIHRAATGLDTACVYGHALTALVLGDGEAPPDVARRRGALVSVPARAAYARLG